jgi:hypothetical protein
MGAAIRDQAMGDGARGRSRLAALRALAGMTGVEDGARRHVTACTPPLRITPVIPCAPQRATVRRRHGISRLVPAPAADPGSLGAFAQRPG